MFFQRAERESRKKWNGYMWAEGHSVMYPLFLFPAQITRVHAISENSKKKLISLKDYIYTQVGGGYIRSAALKMDFL